MLGILNSSRNGARRTEGRAGRPSRIAEEQRRAAAANIAAAARLLEEARRAR